MNTPNDELGIPRIVQLENLLDECIDVLADLSEDYTSYSIDEIQDLVERASVILAREGEEDDLASYE